MTRRTGRSINGDDSDFQHVVDFNNVREQRLAEKRKNTERIFFRNLISVYSMIGKNKMFPIELIDVSEDGCSFQVPHEADGKDMIKVSSSEIPIRLYFSQDTYLEIHVRIQNSRQYLDNSGRYIRYGCTVDQQLKSYPVYQQFVRFLKLYSEHAHKDMGDVSVFYL